MPLDQPLQKAFRRAATFLPAARWNVESPQGSAEPDALCAVSIDPPMIALTLRKESAALPDRRFSITGCDSLKLDCMVLEIKPAGDHTMVFASVERVAIAGGTSKVRWRGAWFDLRLNYPFLENVEVLEDFVSAWTSGSLAAERWTHAAHVAVTGYYAFDHDAQAVYDAMKRGILFFNSCTGVANTPDRGYHETLTRFWSNRITLAVQNTAAPSRLDAARCAVRLFGEDRDLPNLFYSFNVLRDRHARSEWVAPDLEPLPEWCGSWATQE